MPDTSMIHTLLADWDEERSLSREEAVEILDLPKEEMEEIARRIRLLVRTELCLLCPVL